VVVIVVVVVVVVVIVIVVVVVVVVVFVCGWIYSYLMQPVHITTKVVSSNPTLGEVYLIQHYVIKFVNDLRQVGGFLRVLWFPPRKTDIGIVESGVKHHKLNPYLNYKKVTSSEKIIIFQSPYLNVAKRDNHFLIL
jgi:hypothetical protein